MESTWKYFCCVLLITVFYGCKKFLNVRPDNITGINPQSVSDFEEMLNSSSLATPNYLISDLISDDVLLSDEVLKAGGKNSYYVNAYTWDKIVWTPTDSDPMYSDTYKRILQLNIILGNIAKVDDGSVERKEIVIAQAKINRAYYYLQLVNMYGTDYQSSSAIHDLAVPLILTPDGTELPKRNTVQEVYNQILADLSDAINYSSLPNFGVDVIHPGRASALALLARTYLYMGNYDNALNTAERALEIKNTLLDYRKISDGTGDKPFTLKDQESNPEILFARVCIDRSFTSRFKQTLYASSELQQLLGTNDLRFTSGFSEGEYAEYNSYWGDEPLSMQFNYSVGVPEMMLIMAECLARKGEGDRALILVNDLRKYRYSEADYTPLTVDNNEVLTIVLEERRRELFLHGGLRLFDLKRLNREERFKKDLKRISMKDGTIIATMPAGSPRYLIPFSPMIVANNPSMIQNER